MYHFTDCKKASWKEISPWFYFRQQKKSFYAQNGFIDKIRDKIQDPWFLAHWLSYETTQLNKCNSLLSWKVMVYLLCYVMLTF